MYKYVVIKKLYYFNLVHVTKKFSDVNYFGYFLGLFKNQGCKNFMKDFFVLTISLTVNFV